MLTHNFRPETIYSELTSYERLIIESQSLHDRKQASGAWMQSALDHEQETINIWLRAWSDLQRSLYDLVKHGQCNCYCNHCIGQRERWGLFTAQELMHKRNEIEADQLLTGQRDYQGSAAFAGHVKIDGIKTSVYELGHPISHDGQQVRHVLAWLSRDEVILSVGDFEADVTHIGDTLARARIGLYEAPDPHQDDPVVGALAEAFDRLNLYVRDIR